VPKKKISLQAKHLRQSRKRQVRNMSIKSAVRTVVTRARKTITATPAEAAPTVSAAARALDKAATKGVMHPRAAARKKSRLATALNKANSAQS
jgi:small subunit ribosomal protein S20